MRKKGSGIFRGNPSEKTLGVLLVLFGFVAVASFTLMVFSHQKHEFAPAWAVCGIISVAAMALIAYLDHQLSVESTAKLAKARSAQLVEREQLLALINSLGVAIASTSDDGTIRTYNAAMLSLVDTNDSLVGKHANEIFQLLDGEKKPVRLMDLITRPGVIERDDISLGYADGEAIRLSILISPVQGHYRGGRNKIDGYIFVLEDITRRKTLEEERDEFISVISHELRTPITIAEGTISNAMFMSSKEKVPSIIESSLTSAHDQVIYLANMVNDLGTLSRAERGVGDKKETIDLKELCHTIYQEYAPKAAAKGLRLDLDVSSDPGSVETSRLYLAETLQNFITNAIKYTQSGSVTLICKREKDGGVYFAVKDTGIGISKTDQKLVFGKFYRSEDYRTRETSGTGLGLYVVEKLAGKLGTTIHLQSRLNHGSTFSFTLR